MKQTRASVALGAALLLSVCPAFATSAFKASVAQLAQTSPVVVRGTVRRVHSYWDHQRILTDVELEVTETLKGAPGAVVRITQPGGQVGTLGQTVEGLASFAEGEDVLVFLRPRAASGSYMIAGFSQGKYSVQKSPDGRWLAVPQATDTVLVDRATQAPAAHETAPVELSRMRELVKGAGLP
jgi:hypothetical protein